MRTRTLSPLVLSSFLGYLPETSVNSSQRNEDFRREAKAPRQPANLANTCGLYETCTALCIPLSFPFAMSFDKSPHKASRSRRFEKKKKTWNFIELHGGRLSRDTKQRLPDSQLIWQTLVDCTKHVRPFLSLFPFALATSRSRRFEKKKHVLLCPDVFEVDAEV